MIFYFLNFFVGSCLASHACLIYDRFEYGPILAGRSHCDFCQTKLSLLDEIPVFSYLFLNGKCRFCHQTIPYQFLIIELLTGLTFLKTDFSSFSGLRQACFIFFFLLCAIFDYYEQEFPTIFLFPLFLLTLSNFHELDCSQLLSCLLISLLLIIFVLKRQLGAGDLFLYLLLSFFFSPFAANLIFLLASIIIICRLFWTRNFSQPIAYLPYLFLALTIYLNTKNAFI